jgi:tetratricopeptide (TPR) repeat protein
MNKMKKYILLFLFFALCLLANAQETESQLAAQYFNSKEYDKASELYQKLFKANGTKIYFDYYIKCLVELKSFDEAEKALKKQAKKNNDEPDYVVELGYIYKLQEKQDKLSDLFGDLLKRIAGNQYLVSQVANNLIGRRMFDWAEKTYLEGRKKVPDYKFRYEMAMLFAYQANYPKMLDELFEFLTEAPENMQMVQSLIQNFIAQDNTGDFTKMLKTSLLKRVQTNPSQEKYSELLIWYYMQVKDFEKALVQVKAYDRRNNEDGMKLVQLAQVALSNSFYEVAVEAYKAVIAKGQGSSFYIDARLGLLASYYQKAVNEGVSTPSQISKLETDYLATINELGFNFQTIKLIKDLAHLQGFYLNKPEAGIKLLDDALKIRGITPVLVAECKLELADIQLMSGDVWEATLTYAQVEKANEQVPIGAEARFRKARLAYFTGNFQWAQAQLDVLKASTSKLIANDAMDLSLLISENIGEDSNYVPLQKFARADLLIMQNKDSLATMTLDTILTEFPKHELTDNVYFKKSQIAERKKDFHLAIELLQKILTEYPQEILASKALFRMGQLYEQKLGDKAKAQECFKDLLVKYPSSIHVNDARTNFRRLRGDEQ